MDATIRMGYSGELTNKKKKQEKKQEKSRGRLRMSKKSSKFAADYG